MSNQIQKTENNLTQLTNSTWLKSFKGLSVKADFTLIEIQKMQTPQICLLNFGQKTPEQGITVFETVVLDMLEFFGIEWSPNQIRSCAELLFSEYYYWTFAELKHFVLKVKKGDFGKVYGKFAPNELMQYAASYNSEALVARASYQKQEAPPTPTDVEYVPTEQIKDAFSRFADEWEQNIRNQSAAQNEQDKRQRAAQKEMLLRQYCLKHELDFDLMKAELQNHAA